MKQTLALKGRFKELRLIDEAFESGHVGVLLVGDAGVGKSRLAAEAAARMPGWARTTVVGTHGDKGLPFGSFVRFLPATDAGFADRIELMAGLVERIRRLGDRVALVVDDVHLLDPASLQLVQQLLVDGQFRLLMTARTGSAPAARDLPGCAQVDVGPLDEWETSELLAAILGAHVNVLTLHRLWSWTGGNALHLRELVTAGLRDGRLGDSTGSWVWHGAPAVPGDIEAVLADRIAALSPLEVEAVRLLGLFEPLSEGQLTRLCGEGIAEGLEERGLVRVEPLARDHRVWLVHPLYGESIRRRLPRLAGQRLRRRLVAELQASAAGGEAEVIQFVRLRRELGEEVDVEETAAAARAALSLFDAETALTLLEDANWADAPGLALLRARALALLLRSEEAEAVLAAVDTRHLDPHERLRWATFRAENLVLGLLWPLEGLALAEATLAETPPELDTTELQGIRILALCYGDRGDALVDRYEPECTPSWLSAALACMNQTQGRTNAALAHVEPGLADPALPSMCRLGLLLNRGAILTEAGRYAELDATIQEMTDWGVAGSVPGTVGYAATLSGIAAIFRGRFQAADRALADAVSAARVQDPVSALRWVLAWRAAAAALAGSRSAVGEMEESRRIASQRPQFAMMRGSDRIAEGLFLAAGGHLSAARTLALAEAHALVERERPVWASYQALSATVLGAARGAAVAVRGVVADPGAPFTASALEHVRAAAGRDTRALLAVADAWADLGALWPASEAADAAVRLLRWEGKGTRGARQRLAELVADCEPGVLPWRVRDTAARLTSREREIVNLAAQGLSNRDIADSLVVSVRTVENHLHSAYHKLGVTGRIELVSVQRASIAGTRVSPPGGPRAEHQPGL